MKPSEQIEKRARELAGLKEGEQYPTRAWRTVPESAWRKAIVEYLDGLQGGVDNSS